MPNKKGNTYKIEMRNTCKRCGNPIETIRFRTYCSHRCAEKTYRRKYTLSGESMLDQRERAMAKRLSKEDKKNLIQCKICGMWFKQVCSHVVQVHKMSAREYKRKFGLNVKKGLITKDLKKLYKKQVFENNTVNNLKAGAPFRFFPGDPRAGKYERSEETKVMLRKNSSRLRNVKRNK